MKFSDFVKRREVKESKIDLSLAKSLVKTAEMDLKFLANVEINEFSARKIMSNHYDVLRSILEAMAILEGYKVYSHEAFTYFLKAKGEEIISSKFDRFRRIRNKINYYGENISVEEVKEYSEEIRSLIEELVNKYLKNLN